MMAPNGTRFGGWLLNTADNTFGPVGDFDGDGHAEILVTSPWGIGVFKLAGGTFTCRMMAPNGTRFGGWLLNTADNTFGPVGDFDGDGHGEILVTSPWGIGMFKLSRGHVRRSDDGAERHALRWMAAQHRRQPARPTGDCDDATGRAEILVTSPWGLGVMEQSGPTDGRADDGAERHPLRWLAAEYDRQRSGSRRLAPPGERGEARVTRASPRHRCVQQPKH